MFVSGTRVATVVTADPVTETRGTTTAEEEEADLMTMATEVLGIVTAEEEADLVMRETEVTAVGETREAETGTDTEMSHDMADTAIGHATDIETGEAAMMNTLVGVKMPMITDTAVEMRTVDMIHVAETANDDSRDKMNRGTTATMIMSHDSHHCCSQQLQCRPTDRAQRLKNRNMFDRH